MIERRDDGDRGRPAVRRAVGVPLCGALLAAVVLAGCEQANEGTPAGEAIRAAGTVVAAAAGDELLARGEYLVTLGHCHDCHTPLAMGPEGPRPDMTRALTGHPEDLVLPPPPDLGGGPWMWAGAATNTAFVGPWGISYAFNLTPDEATGLGIWTEEMFITAMRTGKHMGQSRPIQPPMPWPNLARYTDEDLKALFAYLKSLPPVVNRVPEYQPPAGVAADPFAAAGGTAEEPAAG